MVFGFQLASTPLFKCWSLGGAANRMGGGIIKTSMLNSALAEAQKTRPAAP